MSRVYKDTLVSVWVREYYDVEVSSKEDFENKTKSIIPYNTEYLFETEIPMQNSKGEIIKEIYISDSKGDLLIYTNAEEYAH